MKSRETYTSEDCTCTGIIWYCKKDENAKMPENAEEQGERCNVYKD